MLSANGLRRMEATDLAELIRPAGFHKRKAQTLKSVSNFMAEFGDEMSGAEFESTCSLRRRLLEIHGVGEETADAILLYALDRTTFVADAYTRRLFTRLGVTPVSWGYEKCRLFSHEAVATGPEAICRVPRTDRESRRGYMPRDSELQRVSAAGPVPYRAGRGVGFTSGPQTFEVIAGFTCYWRPARRQLCRRSSG